MEYTSTTILLACFVTSLMFVNHVTGKELCAIGQYYDRPSAACQNCTFCPGEIVLQLCHEDRDSVCGPISMISIPPQFIRKDKIDTVTGKPVVGVDISREYSWDSLEVVLLCVTTALIVFSLVLAVLVCRTRRFRKDVVYDVTPGYRRFNVGNYTVLDFTEKVSWVTELKQEDV